MNMKILFSLFLIGLLMFGCTGPEGPSTPESEDEEFQQDEGQSTLKEFEGSFTVEMSGGGDPVKTYHVIMTSEDKLVYNPEFNNLEVISESYSCESLETTHIEDPYFPVDSESVGTGSYTQEYSGEDLPVRISFVSDGIEFFPDPEQSEWVEFTTTLNGESFTENGECTLFLYYISVLDVEMETDEDGKLYVEGERVTTSGTAEITLTFSYHEVG